MQTPKTKRCGGHTYSAVPTREENAWLTTERGSSWDNDAKTRVALCVAGLVVVAAACVAAAILWNHFYGAYKYGTTAVFAKVGIGILLGVAAVIGFALVATGAIGISKNVGTHRSVFKEQWEDISESKPLLGTRERNASRNLVSGISTMDPAADNAAKIVACEKHNVDNDAQVLYTKSTNSVPPLSAEEKPEHQQPVSVSTPHVTLTITGDVEHVAEINPLFDVASWWNTTTANTRFDRSAKNADTGIAAQPYAATVESMRFRTYVVTETNSLSRSSRYTAC